MIENVHSERWQVSDTKARSSHSVEIKLNIGLFGASREITK